MPPRQGGIIKRVDEIEDPRRRLLIEALALGLIGTGLPAGNALAQVFGSRPGKLPPGRSIYRITGTALVNDRPANLETQVRPGDTVETGKDSELIFAVGGHAMLLRSNTRMVIQGEPRDASSVLLSLVRIVTGALLSVSRNTPMRIITPTATIGVRGTGWYTEADPGQTYFCTCYGTTEVTASNDPASRTTVVSKAHDRPLYILGKGPAGKSIRDAPFINHTDQELMLIEALVGRTPPFVFPKDDYSGPRRDY